jgi:hypothetical protein
MSFGIPYGYFNQSLTADDIVVWAGWRAIFNPGRSEKDRWDRKKKEWRHKRIPAWLDYVPDRRNAIGEKQDLLELDEWALPCHDYIQKVWCQTLFTSDTTRLYCVSDQYTFVATPNGSCGYMYIGAWQLKPGVEQIVPENLDNLKFHQIHYYDVVKNSRNPVAH